MNVVNSRHSHISQSFGHVTISGINLGRCSSDICSQKCQKSVTKRLKLDSLPDECAVRPHWWRNSDSVASLCWFQHMSSFVSSFEIKKDGLRRMKRRSVCPLLLMLSPRSNTVFHLHRENIGSGLFQRHVDTRQTCKHLSPAASSPPSSSSKLGRQHSDAADVCLWRSEFTQNVTNQRQSSWSMSID